MKAAASVPATTRGFDGGKKVNGRKRHIVVDTLGLLLAVTVPAASVTDRDAARTLLTRVHERNWRVTRVWADGGYTGRLIEFARGVLCASRDRGQTQRRHQRLHHAAEEVAGGDLSSTVHSWSLLP